MSRKCPICNGCSKKKHINGRAYIYCDFCDQWFILELGKGYIKVDRKSDSNLDAYLDDRDIPFFKNYE